MMYVSFKPWICAYVTVVNENPAHRQSAAADNGPSYVEKCNDNELFKQIF